jgi:3'-phosphoadenosine 5'-phosphosulfate sulfotransferase
MKKTIVFMDIVSSSKLWVQDKINMNNVLDELFQIVSNFSQKHGGKLIKSIGDAFMLEFGDVKAALRFGIDFQKELANKRSKKNTNITPHFRMGIAFGEVNKKIWKVQNCNLVDYFGNTVNTGARMESILSPIDGVAVAINDCKKIDEILESINVPKENVKISVFNEKKILKLKRSVRLVPYSIQASSGSELHGVATPGCVLIISQ